MRELTNHQKQLIENHYDDACRIANSLTSKNHLVLWQDVASEALIKAVLSYDESCNTKFTTYLYQITKHLIADLMKREDLRKQKELKMTEMEDKSDVSDHLITGLESRLKTEQLYQYLIDNQSDRNFKILIHRYFGGDKPLTQKELSKQFDISQPRLSEIEKEIKKKIKEAMKENLHPLNFKVQPPRF